MDFFQESFLRNALAASILSGTLCAFLGVYIHLRRIIFIGIALSEVAALGVAAGLVLGVWPEATASVFTVVVALFLWVASIRPFLTQESLLGLTYCLAAAVAVILLAANPMAEAHGVDLISGNLLYSSGGDILLLTHVVLGTFILHFVIFRKLIFVSFDPETAQTLGIPIRAYEFFLYLTLGLAVAVSMKTTGILFVFSSMVIPTMVGLLLCHRVWRVFVTALLVAFVAGPVGLWISFRADLPTTATIVCVEGAIFLAALVARMIRPK